MSKPAITGSVLLLVLAATVVATVVSSPRPAVAQRRNGTRWTMNWYTITGEGLRGGGIGQTVWPATFDQDWRDGPVVGNYSDFVGFDATATVNMSRTGMVTFVVGGDDGVRLAVDGHVVIDDWGDHRYRERSVTINNFAPGRHRLTLNYFERRGRARVMFRCDSDLLTW